MSVAVYFDLDGTLLARRTTEDELRPTAAAFDLAIEDEAVDLFNHLVAQYFRRNVSDGYYRAAERWCEQYGFAVDADAFTDELKRQKVAATESIDGNRESVAAIARDASVGLLTNGGGDVQRMKLEAHGLDARFETLVISAESETMKPEDEIFELARERLPADQYVYVADRLADDLVPARENGFATVYVSDADSPLVDLTVASVAELTPEVVADVADS